jgi:hypothetical protein
LYNDAIADSGQAGRPASQKISESVLSAEAGRVTKAIQTKKVAQLENEVCAQIEAIRASVANIWSGELKPLEEYGGGTEAVNTMLSDFIDDAVASSVQLASQNGYTYNTTTGEFVDTENTAHQPELLRALRWLPSKSNYLTAFRVGLRNDMALEHVSQKMLSLPNRPNTTPALLAISNILASSYSSMKGIVTIKEYSAALHDALLSCSDISRSEARAYHSIIMASL